MRPRSTRRAQRGEDRKVSRALTHEVVRAAVADIWPTVAAERGVSQEDYGPVVDGRSACLGLPRRARYNDALRIARARPGNDEWLAAAAAERALDAAAVDLRVSAALEPPVSGGPVGVHEVFAIAVVPAPLTVSFVRLSGQVHAPASRLHDGAVETFTVGPWYADHTMRRWSNNRDAAVVYPYAHASARRRWVAFDPHGAQIASGRAATPEAASDAGDAALCAYCAPPGLADEADGRAQAQSPEEGASPKDSAEEEAERAMSLCFAISGELRRLGPTTAGSIFFSGLSAAWSLDLPGFSSDLRTLRGMAAVARENIPGDTFSRLSAPLRARIEDAVRDP